MKVSYTTNGHRYTYVATGNDYKWLLDLVKEAEHYYNAGEECTGEAQRTFRELRDIIKYYGLRVE